MNILQKHTAQYFGAMQKITRDGTGAYLYRAERKETTTYYNGKKVVPAKRDTVYHARNYFSSQRKSNMNFIERVLYR